MFLTIGMPLYNNMPIETFLSVLKLFDSIDKNQFCLINTRNYPIHQARNFIVEQFLKKENSDYLLFLDSDMIFENEKDFVKKLFDVGADISSALAFKKIYPYEPTIYRRSGEKYQSINNYEKNKTIEVDGVGMACCLIKKEVFEKLKNPWYEFKRLSNGEFLGEDLTFCKKAKKTGFVIKVDTSLIASHVGGIIDNRTFQATRIAFQLLRNDKDVAKKLIEGLGNKEILDMIKKLKD